MSKKKRRLTTSQKQRKERKLANYPQPVYAVGDYIQVNDDVMDFDWNDLPLGGWVGKVTEVHREPEGSKYDVLWSEETLEKCHPIYKTLAEYEGLQFGTYTQLSEEDIHAFAGGEVVLVDPVDVSQYTDRPLDPDDHCDRLRMIFGTKPMEWFPGIGGDKAENIRLLRRYYEHLLEHLVFPFKATYVKRHDNGFQSTLYAFTAEKLVDPDVIRRVGNHDNPDRLYCSGTDAEGKLLEVPLQHVVCDEEPQKQLLDDHCSWIGDVYMMMGVYKKRDWNL